MRISLCLLVASVALVACKQDASKPAPTTAAGSAGSAGSTGSAMRAAPVPGSIQLFVDEELVGTLAPEQAKLWPRLDALVPVSARRLGTWQTLELVKAGKSVKIDKPSSTHPELVAALFPHESGIAFGMFDPVELAKRGKPTVREDALVQVRLHLAKGSGRGENDHSSDGGGDPSQLRLTIKTKQGDTVLPGDKLLGFTREKPPGETDQQAGWKLTALLAHAQVKGYKRLLLTDAKGVSLTLEQQDLDPAKAVPFIKLNRQGALRFRVYRKQGETWQPSSDLRGLTTIEVLE